MTVMQEQQDAVIIKQVKINALGPCASIFSSLNTGSWRTERPQVDFDHCVKCGTCAMYCPANVITIDKGAAKCVSFMWAYCKGCGICANECPKSCITMVEEKEEEA